MILGQIAPTDDAGRGASSLAWWPGGAIGARRRHVLRSSRLRPSGLRCELGLDGDRISHITRFAGTGALPALRTASNASLVAVAQGEDPFPCGAMPSDLLRAVVF